MKHYKIINTLLTVGTLFLLCASSFGQSKQSKERITVSVEVIDDAGRPVSSPKVISSRNRCEWTADKNGKLTVNVPSSDFIKVVAQGYEEALANAFNNKDGKLTVVLKKSLEGEGEGHLVYCLPSDYISERRVVGSFSKVEGSELEKNPTMSVLEGLSGRLNGFFYRTNSTVPGFTSWDGFVRAPNGGSPVILVDGVERSIEYIEPETIESVELLKDASLKAMFGGVQTNGILMIKTKRGKAYENGVKINFQSGVQMVGRMPSYLNSKEYTTLYNQALENVGQKAIYDPSKYDGSNPILYPDVDYQKEFVKKAMTITRANAQMTGGNDNTQYFVNAGFQTNGGLLKNSTDSFNDQVISVRGNVDNKIFDFITFKLGVNAAIETVKFPVISGTDFMSILSSTRPNEYALRIPGSLVGSDQEYVLGGTSVRQNNPLGQLTQNGFVEREYSYMQSDMAIDIDLNKWVKGLSIRPSVTFDFYNEFTSRKDQDFSVYELVVNPETDEIENSYEWGLATESTKLVQGEVAVERNWVFSNTVKYDRTLGTKHKLTAFALAYLQNRSFNTSLYNLKRINFGVGANYIYDEKYVIDASANYVGVPSFADDKKFGLFPTVGLGWIMSENNFLKEAQWLDYLKVRGSFGMLGSTLFNSNGTVSNFYYRDEWRTDGTYSFSTLSNKVSLDQTGNKNVGFQKSYEINAGVDFAMLKHLVSGSVGYFHNSLNGNIANAGSSKPGVLGNGGALLFNNCKDFESQGIEAELYFKKSFGDFALSLGGNVSYGYSKTRKDVDVAYPDELSALRKITRNGDVKGYRAIGTFTDQGDIDNSPTQSFGNVYPGDIKYADLNNDNVIDARDKEIIANTTPTVQYGINLSLKYKGFNLDVLGYGLAGYDRMLTNGYYENYGGGKYSQVVIDGLPNGNAHPILRADNSLNNFQDSDYWTVNGGFFKLRNAEVGYTLPLSLTSKIRLSGVKVFVRATNLFTISKIKDLDPEYLSAGVSDYPLFTTVTGGLSLSF